MKHFINPKSLKLVLPSSSPITANKRCQTINTERFVCGRKTLTSAKEARNLGGSPSYTVRL